MLGDGSVEVLRQVLDGFNRHDLDAIMSHFAEDCVFESPRGPDRWGRRFAGKDEVRRGLAARFEGITDVEVPPVARTPAVWGHPAGSGGS